MKRRRRGPSRWAKRRAGEIRGYLLDKSLASAEDIAEHYQRDPRQVLDDLRTLEADGRVIGGLVTRPDLLGRNFPVVLWTLTDKD